MRNLKKFLALVLAMMMTLSLMVTVNAKSFDDVDSTSTYAEAIAVLKGLGVVKGDENGKFNPKDPITRAEVAAMIYRLVTADVTDSNVKLYENSGYFFTDVFSGKWYNGYVNYCANNGLVKGVGGDRFAPSADVTGYEALVMILRAIGYTNDDTFSGSDWKFKASGYARELGITDGIAEGTLGQPATREMVAQIMFKGLQAPMVRGNILGYNRVELVADTDANRAHYANYLAAGGTLPICETLMRKSFNIVGKSNTLYRDAYGRPSYQWVYDDADDKTVGTNGPKLNQGADKATYPWITADGKQTDNVNTAAIVNYGDAGKYIISAADDATMKIKIDEVKIYDNVVTECQLTQDVNKDVSFSAYMWLNGQQIMVDEHDNTDTTVSTGDAKADYTDAMKTPDGIPDVKSVTVGANDKLVVTAKAQGIELLKKIDVLHTVDTFINSQGRTMEVYKYTKPNSSATEYDLVFIDTFLGRVVETRAKTVDTAGHTMHPAEADIAVGYDVSENSALKIVTVATDKYKVGDLVLVQTPLATEKTGDTKVDTLTEILEFPDVTDVPKTVEEFTKTTSKNVTVRTEDVKVASAITIQGTKIATKGSDDGSREEVKTGVVGSDGNTYWLSNTYLAGGTGAADGPVLKAYLQEVTNNLINRTFNLYLDHHGYVVGMQETTTSNVGVVTGIDYNRVSAGRYTVSVSVTDVNGNNVDLELLNNVDKDFFENQGAAEGYWADKALTGIAREFDNDTNDANNKATLTKGMLIEWTNVVKNGTTYQVISKTGAAEAWADEDASVDKTFANAAPDAVDGKYLDDANFGDATTDNPIVRTGVTDTLGDADAKALINNDTKFLIANYKVDYSAKPDANLGAMTLEGYKPYTGFKTIPTIDSLGYTDENGDPQVSKVQWTKITSNGQEYFAINASAEKQGYTMIEQKKFTVDESYLFLNSGTTFQFYSTYEALKNGEKVPVNVSNLNSVNTLVQAVMAGSANVELVTFSGKDAAGNVNMIAPSTDVGHFNQQPGSTTIAPGEDDGGTPAIKYPYYKAGVLTFEDPTDTTVYLTMATGAKVLIVNAANSGVKDGTLESINQYAKQTDGDNYFCYELDANGYISVLYIVD